MTETIEQPVVESEAENTTQETTTTSPAIYQRAFSIHIDNPLGSTPTCTFQQEKVVVIDGEVIKQPIGELVVKYDKTDPRAALLHQMLTDYYLELIAPPEAVLADEVPPPESEGTNPEEIV